MSKQYSNKYNHMQNNDLKEDKQEKIEENRK